MNDRPDISIWGTILNCVEIGLNVYEILAVNGSGLMMPTKEAQEQLPVKALFQGKIKDGYLRFEDNNKDIPIYELIKNGHITDPEVLERYGTAEEIERDGKFLKPEYFGEIEPPDIQPTEQLTPIDNGVFFMSDNDKTMLAVHDTVSEYRMSGYLLEHFGIQSGEYRLFDIEKDAAPAIFELSRCSEKVSDQITSWESLMHTLATEFPDYMIHYNYIGNDYVICDEQAPENMFLQQHLDKAAKEPPIEIQDDHSAFEQSEALVQDDELEI